MLTFEASNDSNISINFTGPNKYVRIFGGNLDNDLKVLTNIDAKHLPHAGHRMLSCKVADEAL